LDHRKHGQTRPVAPQRGAWHRPTIAIATNYLNATRFGPAMAVVEEESRMIDFREQLVELLRPNDDGFDDPPREGLVKVFRPMGCWVYRIEVGQEEEFRRWVADRFRLDELGTMEVTGEFPMLRVVSPLD
jgi:hypothetical protein